MEGLNRRGGKLDNVFGCASIDECFSVFKWDPVFFGIATIFKYTCLNFGSCLSTCVCGHVWNGAIIKETHINSNYSVGDNNEKPFIRGVSTLPYRNSLPRLHTNGMACDWLSKLGNANLIYPTVYCKAHELLIHTLKKIKLKVW
ncbi:hypothetical protein JNE25005_47770 (plasmid) [Escherichia coli]